MIAFLRFNMESSNNMMSHYDILRLIVSRFIFISFPRWKLFLGQYFISSADRKDKHFKFHKTTIKLSDVRLRYFRI